MTLNPDSYITVLPVGSIYPTGIVTHGCMRNIKELGEKKQIPAVASFFTILSSLSANWTFGFLSLE